MHFQGKEKGWKRIEPPRLSRSLAKKKKKSSLFAKLFQHQNGTPKLSATKAVDIPIKLQKLPRASNGF